MLLVTGGLGFIGSNFILDWFATSTEPVINVDSLTYAANPANLAALADDGRYHFEAASIADEARLAALFERYAPRAVLHFAAETHVDRSIADPLPFVETNVLGTARLLEVARAYWEGLDAPERARFRFLHVSTDEVYGSLDAAEPAFTESSRYAPNSPYAASKAGADHLVRTAFRTYGLPVLTTHSSSNFGPYQFPEKFIPLLVFNALRGLPLPLYGDGLNLRDWLYVGDHCAALRAVLERGEVGRDYGVGGGAALTNRAVAAAVAEILDRLEPRPDGTPYAHLIEFVADRPGHDRRYAIDASRIHDELGWHATTPFAHALERTVRWYLEHPQWVEAVAGGAYRDWLRTHYGY